MGNNFYSSDFHINHFNLTSHPDSKNYCNRPWKTIEEMNNAIVERFNSVVTNEDTVYFLGDFTLGKFSVVEEWLPKFNRKKFVMIPGNHDRIFKKFDNQQLREKYLQAGVDELHLYTEIKIGKFDVALSHLPYRPPESSKHDDLRYLSRRPENKGLPLIHGHCHSTPENRIRGKQIDVGVDAWNWYPVPEQEILKILEEF